jgi:2-hydroxy-3-keto-5-methylthiopentenyl-1-phosphate phosphatase
MLRYVFSMLILCDFDGTVTLEDVTNCIWDHYHGPQWREWLLPDYRAGKTSTLQVMAGGFKPIRAPLEEIMVVAQQHRTLRAGFAEFVQGCSDRGWPLHIISCGLDVYIRELLPQGIPIVSYKAVLGEDGWDVTLPDGVELKAGEDFKIHAMERLLEKYPGRQTVFIGDGRNDFPIAQKCRYVFTRSESTLERLCRENNIVATSFAQFDEILHSAPFNQNEN